MDHQRVARKRSGEWRLFAPLSGLKMDCVFPTKTKT